jgi:hypothetical protein
MRVGIIADTHDHVPYIEKAVEIFNGENLAAVFHCGDFISPFSMIPFKRLKAPLYAVFGNNDGEREGLASMFSAQGWTLNERPWSFDFQGKKVVMLHEPAKLDVYLLRGGVDLIVFGHTHEKHFQRTSGIMVVNPGEGCGWVKGTASIAVADLTKNESIFINL